MSRQRASNISGEVADGASRQSEGPFRPGELASSRTHSPHTCAGSTPPPSQPRRSRGTLLVPPGERLVPRRTGGQMVAATSVGKFDSAELQATLAGTCSRKTSSRSSALPNFKQPLPELVPARVAVHPVVEWRLVGATGSAARVRHSYGTRGGTLRAASFRT